MLSLTDLALWDENKRDIKKDEGAKIPWSDPDFSRRMLHCHLSQDHDWASRRKDIIDKHISWMKKQLNLPARILDLACGPGLYTQALATDGFHCVGVDFSPASIEYARKQPKSSKLHLEYVLDDVRNYQNDQAFDCIMMVFGEINVFSRQDAAAILKNCANMLLKDGLFILEAHTYEAVSAIGNAPDTWQRHSTGLFSDKPHLCLQENNWNDAEAQALSRYFILDASCAEAQCYTSFMQAYTNQTYKEMLDEASLSVQQILDEDSWPAGEVFQGKLQTFICKKF